MGSEAATSAGIPALDKIVVVVRTGGKGVLQDVGNCHGCTKAIVDGIVDAGVIPDDKPEHLRWILYAAPVRDKEHWIEVTVHDASAPIDYSFLHDE